MQSVTPVAYSIVNFLDAVISSFFFRNLMGGKKCRRKKKEKKKNSAFIQLWFIVFAEVPFRLGSVWQ